MSVKTTLVIGATVIGLAVGGAQALAPRTAAEIDQQRREQQVSDLSDANDASKERMRQDGMSAGEAERRSQLEPVKARPAEPEAHPKIKVKWRLRP